MQNTMNPQASGEPLFTDIVVFGGAGRIGQAAVRLLANAGFRVTVVDRQQAAAMPAGVRFVQGDVNDPAFTESIINSHQAVLSCLSHEATLPLAEAAVRLGKHMFAPTEVMETAHRMEQLAGNSGPVVAMQCGLAPGLTQIIARYLTDQFTEVQEVRVRVGALADKPTGAPLYHARTWSEDGMAKEYVAESEIIRGGQKHLVEGMSEIETAYIGGRKFEIAHTSGGYGSLPDSLLQWNGQYWEGSLDEADYKTIRFPGHWKAARDVLASVGGDPEKAAQIFRRDMPATKEDMVVLRVEVTGVDAEGESVTKFFEAFYYPRVLEGEKDPTPAISWTTAAGIVGIIEQAARGSLGQGYVRSEDSRWEDFLRTSAGSLLATRAQGLAEVREEEIFGVWGFPNVAATLVPVAAHQDTLREAMQVLQHSPAQGVYPYALLALVVAIDQLEAQPRYLMQPRLQSDASLAHAQKIAHVLAGGYDLLDATAETLRDSGQTALAERVGAARDAFGQFLSEGRNFERVQQVLEAPARSHGDSKTL